MNKKDNDNGTAVTYAAMSGHVEIVSLLVDLGADLDVQDAISAWTPLMQAAYYGHKEVVELLIGAGADATLRSSSGCTAFDIAAIIGDNEIVYALAAVSLGALGRDDKRLRDASKVDKDDQVMTITTKTKWGNLKSNIQVLAHS